MDLVKLFNDVGRIADALEKIAGQGDGIVSAVTADTPAQQEAAKTRTRRTKAEIEAAKAVEAPAPVPVAEAEAVTPQPAAAPAPAPVAPVVPAPAMPTTTSPFADDATFIKTVSPYVKPLGQDKVVALLTSIPEVNKADPKLSQIPVEKRQDFIASLEAMKGNAEGGMFQ